VSNITPGPNKSVSILGTRLQPMRMEEAIATVASRIEKKQFDYINFCCVNDIVECVKSRNVLKAVNGGTAVSDGMPLVWLCRYYGYKKAERIYGPDFMLAFCRYSATRGIRHFFYGGGPGIAQQLARKLSARFPGLVVAGSHTPGVLQPGEMESPDVIHRINACKPDIVWTGLGAPKQNLWVAQHREMLNAPVLAAVGAAFDFHTGRTPQAPAWMQRNGLEWLFRFIKEPRRLALRYLVNNPIFIILTLLQLSGLHTFCSQEKKPS